MFLGGTKLYLFIDDIFQPNPMLFGVCVADDLFQSSPKLYTVDIRQATCSILLIVTTVFHSYFSLVMLTLYHIDYRYNVIMSSPIALESREELEGCK